MNTKPKAKEAVGVVLGRFQLPSLHVGHKALIRKVLELHQKAVIVIAETPISFNRRNPLTGKLRKALLDAEFAGQSVQVVVLKNNESDEIWSRNFDQLLTSTVPDANFIIYGARDNSLRHYSGQYQTEVIDLDLPTSATKVREKVAHEYPKGKRALKNFAAGVIHTTAHIFPVSYTTMDLAVIREDQGTLQTLLCYKEQYQKWFFCGGFIDPTDETILDAVKREKTEELGINLEIGDYKFLGDYKINDWRYRGTEHGIRTMFHVGTRLWGEAKAGDDIDMVQWFDLNRAEEIIADEHKPLLAALKKHVETK
jgi:bifunctional NMN adenylyltransferase/nudix hydrolase